MEVKVNSVELIKILEQVTRVIAPKNCVSILQDVLVRVKGGVMVMTASDSEMWLSMTCSVENDEDFAFCVDAKAFLDASKNLNDTELVICVDAEKKTVRCSYGNGEFVIPCDSSFEFPRDSACGGNASFAIVKGKKVSKAIELVAYSTSANDVVQPIKNGVHFDFTNEGMVTVGTDGSRLARHLEKGVTINDGGNVKFTIPKKAANTAMNVLRSLDEDVKIAFDGGCVCVSNATFKLTTRVLEYKYPNYNSVIPPSGSVVVTVDKTMLMQSIRRVLPMSDDSVRGILFRFSEGRVSLEADDVNNGRYASETVECDCNTTLEIKLNGDKVADALKNIDDDNVVIELSEESKPALFYPAFNMSRNEYIALVSPMIL